MADIIKYVGNGLDYSGPSGFIDAIDGIPSDFSTIDDNYIIRIVPDIDYDWITSTKTINPSNPSAGKRIIIEPAPGYEHNGVFNTGVRLVMNTAGNTARFNLTYPYVTVRDIEFEIGLNNTTEFRIFDIYGTNVVLQNLIVQHKAGTAFLFYWRAGSSGLQNNCIGHTTTTTGASFFFAADGGSSVIEVNDNICYGALRYYFGGGANITSRNNGCFWYLEGSVGTFDVFQAVPGTVTGSYANTVNTPYGSNPLQITLASAKFQDIVNKNFKLRIDSPLINTGSMKSVNNPNSINNELWNGNHRSPYNNIIISNVFMQPPEDVEYIRGNHNNRVIFSVLSPGLDAVVGRFHSQNHDTEIGYSQAGYITKCNINSGEYIKYNFAQGLYGKRFTVSVIGKGVGSGTNTSFIAKSGFLFAVNDTNKIVFDTGTYKATGTVTTYINPNDYYNAILYIDLEKNTDAERVKIYLFQKGALHHVTLTFTGSAPSSLSIGLEEWDLGFHAIHQGITTIWDRCLSYDELFTIGYDPYVIFRSDKKFLRNIGVIKESVSGFWRHHSEIFGMGTHMAGTSTLVA